MQRTGTPAEAPGGPACGTRTPQRGKGAGVRSDSGRPNDPAGTSGETGREPPAAEIPAVQRWFEHSLVASRLLILIPVIVLLLTAIGSFIYGADTFIRSVHVFVGDTTDPGSRLGLFLIVLDVFLSGVTLMIAAFGLYELFILERSSAEAARRSGLPHWLRMRDLDDLKFRIISMLIMIAAITFIDQLVEFHDERTALFMGIGVAIVIVALTVFLRWGKPRREPARPPPEEHHVAATRDQDRDI